MLQKALELVEEKFQGHYDKAGRPYIEHLKFVSNHGRNEMEKIIGMLHDILEDTNLTSQELYQYGFSEEVIRKVELLTRLESQSYSAYIDHLIACGDENVLYIKKIDLEHNMDLDRLAVITPKDMKRVDKKYRPAYERVCHALTFF